MCVYYAPSVKRQIYAAPLLNNAHKPVIAACGVCDVLDQTSRVMIFTEF